MNESAKAKLSLINFDDTNIDLLEILFFFLHLAKNVILCL
jgi:hypothetical protein